MEIRETQIEDVLVTGCLWLKSGPEMTTRGISLFLITNLLLYH